MPSTQTRRSLLRRAVSSVAVGLAGCLGSDPDTAPTTSSARTTATLTSAETDDPGQAGTYTCDEQDVYPDVTVLNNRGESVTAEVTVEDRTAESVLLDTSYDVPAGKRVDEADYVFTSLAPETDHEIWATATVGAESDEADVSVVARNAINYAVAVRVTDDGVTVFDHHVDPGVDFNWNCYPRD